MSKFFLNTSQIKELTAPQILKDLHEVFSGSQPSDRLNHEYIHASDITSDRQKFCARDVALRNNYNIKPPELKISTSLGYTFSMGNYLQESITRNLYKKAVGGWRCGNCSSRVELGTHKELIKDCRQCTNLGQDHHYRELVIRDKNLKVSAAIDLIYNNPTINKWEIVECKSIDKDQFKELKAPLAEHRTRTKLYLKLLKHNSELTPSLMSRFNLEKAYVLYYCKGFGTKEAKKLGTVGGIFSPFKVFELNYDDLVCSEELKNIKDLRNYQQGLREELPRRLCESIVEHRACICVSKGYCFT